MEMKTWAKREIDIACERERDGDNNGFDYGCACYKSALKAFNSLCKDGHSGFSIQLTKNILNRLIDNKPLTPIEDTDDIWTNISDISGLKGEEANYQCKRMGSLFKYVYADGTIKYSDVNRVYGYDIDDPDCTYTSGLTSRLIDDMFPITMPYYPENNRYKVACETFLTDMKNGDFDTKGILHIIKPDGTKVEVNKFYKEGEKDWIEISIDEYKTRSENRINKL